LHFHNLGWVPHGLLGYPTHLTIKSQLYLLRFALDRYTPGGPEVFIGIEVFRNGIALVQQFDVRYLLSFEGKYLPGIVTVGNQIVGMFECCRLDKIGLDDPVFRTLPAHRRKNNN